MSEINNKRSYTEYTVTEPTTDFIVGFDDYTDTTKDTIVVTIDRELAESQGYVVLRKSAQVVTITPAVTEGTVRLQRETAIDDSFHKFTAGALFSAKAVDENFEQVRHSQQEVRDSFVYTTNYVNSTLSAYDARITEVEDSQEGSNQRLAVEVQARKQGDLDSRRYAEDILGMGNIWDGISTRSVIDTETGLSQAAINAALKLDTGITATAKYGGVERTQADKNNESISVKDFGIKGDGTDEAAKLRLAIAATPKRGILDFLGLEVSVGSSIYITGKSKFRIVNGSIKALATMITNTEQPVIRLVECNDFRFEDFIVDANRQERTPAEKSIHGIHIVNSKGFYFIGVKAINGVCDNLTISGAVGGDRTTRPENGLFIDCFFDSAYRNNCTIGAGGNIHFLKCTFSGADGTLPMAGVDIESNGYEESGLIEDITFDDCRYTGNTGWQFMATAHDFPRNIRIIGGVVQPRLNKSSPLSIGNKGGMLIANRDSYVEGTSFENFEADDGLCLRHSQSNVAVSQLNVEGLKFDNCKSTTIYAHGDSGDSTVRNCNFRNSAGMSFFNSNVKIEGCISNDGEGIFILASSASKNVKAKNNTSNNNVGSRVIFIEGEDAEVVGNRVNNPTGFTYAIQATGLNATVDWNTVYTEDIVDTPLLAVNSGTARSVMFNNLDNKSLTVSPYRFTGTSAEKAASKAAIGFNKGLTMEGEQQGVLSATFKNKVVAVGARPDASKFDEGTTLYDKRLNTLITSTGTSWYVGGFPAPEFSTRLSEELELTPIAADETKSYAVDMTGVDSLYFVDVKYNKSLQGTILWAEVTSIGVITVYHHNPSAVEVSVASGSISLLVRR